MESSNKAFDQVKRILEKLDRSIDEARTRRLGGPEEEAGTPVQAGEPAPVRPAEPVRPAVQPAPAPAAAPEVGPGAKRSMYGRAKPLRRDGGADPTMWRRPTA